MPDISPETQEQLRRYQMSQQQLQFVLSQKLQMDMQMRENNRALDELKKLGDDAELFKAVGRILIKSKKKDLEKELADSKETMEIRIKTLEKQENKLREQLNEMQKSLESQLRPTGS